MLVNGKLNIQCLIYYIPATNIHEVGCFLLSIKPFLFNRYPPAQTQISEYELEV